MRCPWLDNSWVIVAERVLFELKHFPRPLYIYTISEFPRLRASIETKVAKCVSRFRVPYPTSNHRCKLMHSTRIRKIDTRDFKTLLFFGTLILILSTHLASKSAFKCPLLKIFFFSGSKNIFLFFSGSKMFGDRDFLQRCYDFLADKSDCLPDHTQYVVIDANSRSLLPRNMLVRSNIFPDESGKTTPIFFFPKD